MTDRVLPSAFLLRGSNGGAAFSAFNSWFGEAADVAIFRSSLDTDGTVPLLDAYVLARYGL